MIIKIDNDEYDRICSEWTKIIFGKIHYESDLESKFDRSLGIYFLRDFGKDSMSMVFEIKNEKKFMLAVMKYSIKFKTL